MKPRKQKANGLIGRCLLAGTLAVVGLVQGCQPLSNVQEQRLYGLTRLGIHHQEQKERNEAIRESGAEVNVYIGEENTKNTYSKEEVDKSIDACLRSYGIIPK